MKTILEWLEELPQPYRDEAIANYDEDYRKGERPTSGSVSSALFWSFDWEKSTQGGEYWSSLWDKLVEARDKE